MLQRIQFSPLVIGLISSVFFASTFVINRLMAVEGGHWLWSAAFRYYWMAVILLFIVTLRKELKPLLQAMKKDWAQWLLWSTVGFGLFYACLCYAAAYGPSWLVAGTFEVTIIAGMLVAPLLDRKQSVKTLISKDAMLFSLVILAGIVFMQYSQAQAVTPYMLVIGIVPVVLAAFFYPLGNRAMMRVTGNTLNATQRTLGMTLASLPFWIILSVAGAGQVGLPASGQVLQTGIVALFAGVIATVLFFSATDRVKNKPKQLAAVEATQAVEVVVALFAEMMLLQTGLPDVYALTGICLVMLGILLHSKHSR